MAINNKKILCLHCSDIINPKHHSVCVSTYNRFDGEKELPNEHAWFHFQCWVDFFNIRVERKVRNQVQFMQSKALEIFNDPAIKSILSQIKGTDNIFSMLNTDLDEKIVSKEKVLKKLRKKKKKREL